MSKGSKTRRARERAKAAPLRLAVRAARDVADAARVERCMFTAGLPGHGGKPTHGVYGFGSERSGSVRTYGAKSGPRGPQFIKRRIVTGTVPVVHGIQRVS